MEPITSAIILQDCWKNEKNIISEKNHKFKKFKTENVINLSLNLKLFKSKTFFYLRDQEYPYIPEFLEKYTIIEVLGSGFQAKVYKVLSQKDKEFYVAKVIILKDDEESLLSNTESLVLQSVRHSNLQVYVEEFTSISQLILITKYFPSNCLSSYLRNTPISLHYIKAIVLQLLNVVRYLHLLNIMHRDIKASNILISKVDQVRDPQIFEIFDQQDLVKEADNSSKLSIRLIDFGVSKIYNPNEESFSPYGDLANRSPEMKYEGAYDEKIDIWGVGIVMMGLCLGREILPSDLIKLKDGRTPERLDPLGADLLGKLLKSKAAERISEKDAISHEWFRE